MLLNTRGIRNSFRFGKVEADFCPQGLPSVVPPRIEFAAAGQEKRRAHSAVCVLTPQMAIDKFEVSVSPLLMRSQRIQYVPVV